MLNNPELILSLIGFDGILLAVVAIVATRLLSDEGNAAKVEKKVEKATAGLEYLKGRLDNLMDIVADGEITADEVQGVVTTAKEDFTSVKETIKDIVG